MNKNIFIYGGLYKTASEFLNEKYLKIWTKKNLQYLVHIKKNREIYKNF